MREARRGTLEADRSGPETSHDEPGEMTLAERFISAFRLPYVLGCFLFGVVVFGFLNSLLAKYVESTSLPVALQTASSWQYLAEDALFAYSFYAPRYMRAKLWETAHSVEALLPDGRLGFRQAFAGISSARPQVGTWVVFLGGLLLATNVPAILGGPSTIVFNLDPTSRHWNSSLPFSRSSPLPWSPSPCRPSYGPITASREASADSVPLLSR